LQQSLDDAIAGLNASCLERTAATSLAERKLAQFGFTGWTVTLRSPTSSSSPNTTNGAPTVRSSSVCYDAESIDPSSSTVELIPIGAPATADSTVKQLADKLRPLTQSCESLPSAVASVRAAASDLGLSESARTYQLNAVKDNSLRCAAIYETVGGTIFLTVRGPSSS
jgi:predicted aconitase